MTKLITTKYENIITIDNLYAAYKSAIKSKGLKKRIATFQSNLSIELYKLFLELIQGTYCPQKCYHFEIWCTAGQKKRQISAPAIRDCVVQHLIYQQICPQFEKFLIHDSYGCRKYKGTHRAAKQTKRFVIRSKQQYYLQIDIRKYYYNIKHDVLRSTLSKYIEDNKIVDLMMKFCQKDDRVGLDVGCLLSQFYGLLYLNYFDSYCKRVLKLKYYVRYVDDIVIIGLSKNQLKSTLANIQQFLHNKLGLSLSKYKINNLQQGINFVGYRTFKHTILIRKRTLHNFHKAIKERRLVSLNGLIAHSVYTNSYKYFLKQIQSNLSITKYKALPKFARYDLFAL